MARAIWTGSLSFGLVNVPVGLFSATEEKSIHFNQFQAGTADRVRNKRVNERTGEEVPYAEITKGYDLGGGEYVILTPEEIASVAPGRTKTIDVSAFVDLDEIDPVYFSRPYYLAPTAKGGGKGAERAYALLRDAMMSANKVALATFVMREKQYLVAIRPRDDALVLETLLYPDEVRDPVEEIDTLPVEAGFEQRELEMAKLLIDSMATEWDPSQYHDAFRGQLEELIENKRAGNTVAVEAPEPQAAPVVDLLQALEASVQAARSGRATPARGQAARASAKPSATATGSGRKARQPQQKKAASRPAGKAEDLSSLGKAELLRRAADLEVAGRSKMSRDELEAAVAAGSSVRRRKAS